ncbi:MAG: DUF3102 domain-containing protein [Clostridia bacterium]|nr:DUF3102 domain-containing protein [Clostridia bacterium]
MNEIINRSGDVIAAEINFIKRRTQETMLSAAVEIGRLLCEAKVGVPYGDWGKWLEENVDYSVSTANNLMKLYNEYGDKPQQSLFDDNSNDIFAMLSPSQALVLTALPKEERKEFVETHDVSDISVRELQKEVDRLKAEKAASDKSAQAEKAELQKKLKDSDTQRKKAEGDLKAANEECTKSVNENWDLKSELKKTKAELEELKANPPEPEQVPIEPSVDLEAIRKKVEAEYTARLSAAEAQNQSLQKKLTLASSAALHKFNIHFGLWQQEYQTLAKLLTEIEAEEPERAEKLRQVLQKFAGEMDGGVHE